MSARPSPISIPISSLLPLSSSSSSSSHPASQSYLPSPSYISGPLPPTSPIHLALNYLKLADERPYEPFQQPPNDQDSKGKGKKKIKDDEVQPTDLRSKERVLIITGSKWNYVDSIQEEDEDTFRSISGKWEVLKRLKRIDIRSCPTPSHLQLLLTLLTESDSRLPLSSTSNKTPQPQYLESTPSVVILWDIAGMFMCEQSLDENEPPPKDEGMPGGEDEHVFTQQENGRKFRSEVCLPDYMSLLAATRAAVDHLNTLHPSDPPVQLMVLEPSLNALSSLPILPPLSSENEDPKMPKSARERKVLLVDGARWIFGTDSIGMIHQISGDRNTTSYFCFTLDKDREKDQNQSYQIRKRKCSKADYSDPGWQGGDKMMGWSWEWIGS
ncbi:hypothetical protein I203_104151 [Kwoniella mangroviensis CBS 8507]|uniref:uncharacterized protein n=1 Tax=Kwoniella mangroviensis CBS 8507 TaxID=1296122 RepID=UPI00080D816F|nr:uncharacterized protein I203_00902 [Kwoniella mangroviensis CBS 8507]OCF70765.1 hypothetical protein I203_00902 [Kwoniella mangroviensis CBS 8507]